MAYSELIKKFETIRNYMRDFYAYGFRTRSDFGQKSARSYDNERRRAESWLSDAMTFRQDSTGKRCFISVDNRTVPHNPLYRAFQAKSFTDKDITLHFILLDILADGKPCPFRELTERTTDYLAGFEKAGLPDDSTVRNKLKEYEKLGLLRTEKRGKELLYSLNPSGIDLTGWEDALAFASETEPLGVVGSFLLNRLPEVPQRLSFKHHYLMGVLDSEIVEELLTCRRLHRRAELTYGIRWDGEVHQAKVYPLHIYQSVQNGRGYLMAYNYRQRRPKMYRLDRITRVRPLEEEPVPAHMDCSGERFRQYLWGASAGREGRHDPERLELTLRVGPEEGFVIERLQREKRCGQAVQLDEATWRYTAEVYDARELLPWLRTFIGRIVKLECSNPAVTEKFYRDLRELQQIYGGDGDDL